MIDAAQSSDEQFMIDSIISSYRQELTAAQDKIVVLKANLAGRDKKVSAMAEQMEVNQTEIARLADMVRELGGDPFPAAEGATGD